MQLSEKPKVFCRSVIAILGSTINVEHFEKNDTNSLSISEVIDSKKCANLNSSKLFFLKIFW